MISWMMQWMYSMALSNSNEHSIYFVWFFDGMLRDLDKAIINCGHEYFKALGEDALYMVASNYENLIN